MRALKIIGIIILVLVGLFLLVAAFLPKEVHIKETKSIDAPASVIFEQVNDLKNWEPWNPFQTPEMELTYEGEEKGVGAIMRWDDKARQKGSMEITESEPYSRIFTIMRFMNDTRSNATSTWTFEEGDEATEVTWTLDITDMSWPVGRYMALVFPGWMKPVYQEGLDSLKAICENMPKYRMSGITEVDVPAGMAVTITDSVAMDDMSGFFSMAFPKLFGYIMENGQQPVGMPYAKYHSWEEGQKSLTEAGMLIAAPLPGNDEITVVEIPATRALKITHYGPYESLGMSWGALMNHMEENGFESAGSPYEVYMNDPQSVPETEVQTDIYWPVK